MGKLEKFVELVNSSRLLAPNLRVMTLRLYTGNEHSGNAVARAVVRKHLAALRWMNPNAVIYLREEKGQGVPEVEYTLWTDGSTKKFEVLGKLTAEEVVAKVMMGARDPDLDAVSESTTTDATTARVAPVTADTPGMAGATARRAYSTLARHERGTELR